MGAEPISFVLDSFALLSHLQDEGGRGRIVDLLEQAQQGNCHLLLSSVNLGEVCYVIERRRGLRDVQLVLAAVDSLPIEILPADRDAVLAAAHLKAHYPISFADAFAATAAQARSAILLTGDPEFKSLSPVLQIEWLAS
ncbi:MAG: type II toxin-antitoxin system VapC family toxin [Omnitrophica WOR_2 bacterium]